MDESMRPIVQGVVEAAIPLVAGVVLTLKLVKNRNNKLYYFGPALLFFGFLLIAKSVVNAETSTVAELVAKQLRGEQTFPAEADEYLILTQIRATGPTEVTYDYLVTADEAPKIENDSILAYACKSSNYKVAFEHGISIVFEYRNNKNQQLSRVISSNAVCASRKSSN